MRAIIAGLYNSGSTCLAGCMHRLGVDMGSPFWRNEKNNHYEPYDLSCLLRHFWNEPNTRENTPQPIRVEILRRWVIGREVTCPKAVGAKHPLLALSLNDLLQAWGLSTKFIWCYRTLEESIIKLKRRKWFDEKAEYIQRQLWEAIEAFQISHKNGILRLDYHQLRKNRERVIDEITEYLEIEPSAEQRQEALNWVQQD
jgi:hypothetical protein